jgi:hypothetical protein
VLGRLLEGEQRLGLPAEGLQSIRDVGRNLLDLNNIPHPSR